MAIELATAYVSLIPETSKIAPGVSKALTGAEKQADKSGQSMGQKLSTGMGRVLKKSAIGVGVSAGGALGAGLAKGLSRLNSIEQAEAKLKGLGHSAQTVGGIMENSLASVKGTAFGLEEAATTAAGLVAANIKPGKELEQVLKTVGDTATIAGTSMADMGTIFGSVAARGKLQGDDMLQLLSRGVPVLQLLADETGKTSAEISDMVSKGQIDFATFERAMRKGMGGAALEAGNTVSGAFRNMGAAAGRLGATLSGPLFSRAAGGINGVTDALDTMNAKAKPLMERFDGWLTSSAVPALERFGTSAKVAFDSFKNSGTVSRTMQVLSSLGQVAADLVPTLINIGTAVGKASAALGVSSWQVFLTALEAVGVAAQAITPPLEFISKLMADHPGVVAAAVAAWTGFKTIPDVISKVTKAVQPQRDALSTLSAGISDVRAYYKATGEEMGRFSAAVRYAGMSSNTTLQTMGRAYTNASHGMEQVAIAQKASGNTFLATTASMGAAARGLASGGLAALKTGAKNVLAAFGGPWGIAFAGAAMAVTACMQGLADMGRVIDAQRDLATNAATAYTNMFDAIVEGGNRVDVAKTAVDSMTSSIQTMADNGPNWFHRGLLAIEEHTYGLMGLETEYMKAGTAVRQTSDSAKAAGETMKQLGITNEQLAETAVGSSVAYENMHAKLMASGRGGEFLAGELERLRNKFIESQAAADAMGPAGARFAQVLDDISAKTGTAEDRASKLRIALMELAGVKMSAAEAGAQLTNTIDQVAQQMGSFEGATLGANGQLDVTTKAGADAHHALMDLGDAMQRSVASGNDATEVYAQFESQLSGLKDQLGLTDEQYQQLLDTYMLTPDKLTTVAEVQADPAKAALLGLNEELKSVGDEKTVTMKVTDAAAQQQLEQMGFKLKQLDENGTVEINIEDQQAQQKLQGVVAEFGKIDNATPTAHAILDADELFATKEYALTQLATIDLQRPTPLANMDVTQLNAKHIEALQQVGLLDGQTPTPDAYLNIDQLDADQQIALAKIFDLDSQRPTPISDLNKDQLDVKADTANARLKVLHDTKTEPKVTAKTNEAMTKLGGVKNLLGSLKDKVVNVIVNRHDNNNGHASGGRFAQGGKLPAYATGDRHDGYRLPTTGRGSNGTDKWLALDENNMPVARLDHGEWVINRRSSAKYDKELAAINAGTFPKLPGYADGGLFDDLKDGSPLRTADDFLRFVRGERVAGVQASRSLEGAPYVWGGSNWGDCSGTSSALAAFAVGLPPFPRKFATGSQESWLRAHGFRMGKGPAGTFRTGWFNGGAYGGHTSSTLPDGTNVEMGGARGNGQIGGNAAPYDHPQYTHHAWIPAGNTATENSTGGYGGSTTGGDQDLVALDDEGQRAAETVTKASEDPNSVFYGTGADSWSDLAGNLAKTAVSGHISDVLNVLGIPNELPPLVKAGQQWFMARRDQRQRERDAEKDRQALIDTAEKIDSEDTSVEPVDNDDHAGGQSPQDAVRAVMAERGWGSGEQWDAVDFIVSHESGWNPTAVNPSSGAFGLFQMLGATKDKYLPDSSTDPAVQARAGAAYIADRYGTPVEARRFWEANRWYDRGGVARGKGHMLKNTLDPERVLSPEQTRAFEELVFEQLPALTGTQGLAPVAGEMVSSAVSNAATAAVDTAVSGALSAAAVVPGAAGLAAGVPGVGAVAKLGADAAGWYAGQVTQGVVGSLEQYGRDLMQIPISQVNALIEPIAPVVGAARSSVDSLVSTINSRAGDTGGLEYATATTGGGDTFQFIAENRAGMFSDFRRESAKRLRGRQGAR